jgi:hypothetical protein
MDKLAPASVSQSASTCGGCCECTELGLRSRGGVALCLLIGIALLFRLDFFLVGLMIVAALVATYIAGRIDKKKARGPWAKDPSDS